MSEKQATNQARGTVPTRQPGSPAMTVEEARAVRWLRDNPRPLGELLDEGYLDEKRLEWAAQWAYSSQLREAAAVLLAQMREQRASPAKSPPERPPSTPSVPVLNAGITVEQARSTPWPFRPYRGQPMGPLVDARRLSLKDLANAVETAWDAQVRRAAAVMLAQRLSQAVEEPPPPAGPLKVVSGGRSFALRQELWVTMWRGFFAGVVLTILAAASYWSISHMHLPDPEARQRLIETVRSPGGIFALLAAILILLAFWALVGWVGKSLIEAIFNWFDRKIDEYRKAQEGEERVVEALRQSLDGRWTLFRNVELPGRKKADIDLILVGPPGVWAIEVKTWAGEHRNIGEHWERRAGNRWVLLKESPSRQAQNNAVRLADFLRADGIRQWVNPAVVWADPESRITVENPMVPVWTLEQLPDEVGNIWQEQRVEESTLERIVTKLTILCQRQARALRASEEPTP